MPDSSEATLLPKHRLETLCDGIFSIAMTLMILDLKTPENIPPNLAQEELPNILYNLLPSIEAYAVSFIILSVFWLRHQIHFKYITYVDRRTIFVNIFFLLLTGFVPFTVGIMMRYPDYLLSFQIYAINLLLLSSLLTYQWFYVSHHNEIFDSELGGELKKRFLVLSVVPTIIFVTCLLVSFISIRAAFFILYLDPLFYVVYKRMGKKKMF